MLLGIIYVNMFHNACFKIRINLYFSMPIWKSHVWAVSLSTLPDNRWYSGRFPAPTPSGHLGEALWWHWRETSFLCFHLFVDVPWKLKSLIEIEFTYCITQSVKSNSFWYIESCAANQHSQSQNVYINLRGNLTLLSLIPPSLSPRALITLTPIAVIIGSLY